MGKPFSWQGWKAVAAVATSLVAIGTAFIAYQTFRVSSQTLQANTRQQTSDRFVKAIEQLGNKDSLDVRLGGIYGLEHLARDSPSDHPAVFDVLTAFVRGHAPRDNPKCADPSLHLTVPVASSAAPSVDIQTTIEAISRRERKNDRSGQLIDLSGTCLVGANLHELQLPGIWMLDADLRFAFLQSADLHHAELARSDLSSAEAAMTNLDSADLEGCKLEHANFSVADLGNADLSGADLTRVLLGTANLTGAVLNDVNLTEAVLNNANLTGASLDNANLRGAHLLYGANLTGAVLSGANLSGADLSGTNLSGTNLSGADLSGANLTAIYYDASTTWPKGFRPPPSRSH